MITFLVIESPAAYGALPNMQYFATLVEAKVAYLQLWNDHGLDEESGFDNFDGFISIIEMINGIPNRYESVNGTNNPLF